MVSGGREVGTRTGPNITTLLRDSIGAFDSYVGRCRANIGEGWQHASPMMHLLLSCTEPFSRPYPWICVAFVRQLAMPCR